MGDVYSMAQTLVDPSQLFLTGNVLETVYQWSNILKSFQQRLSPDFARQEAPVLLNVNYPD